MTGWGGRYLGQIVQKKVTFHDNTREIELELCGQADPSEVIAFFPLPTLKDWGFILLGHLESFCTSTYNQINCDKV